VDITIVKPTPAAQQTFTLCYSDPPEQPAWSHKGCVDLSLQNEVDRQMHVIAIVNIVRF
jgi:hypothetical protein